MHSSDSPLRYPNQQETCQSLMRESPPSAFSAHSDTLDKSPSLHRPPKGTPNPPPSESTSLTPLRRSHRLSMSDSVNKNASHGASPSAVTTPPHPLTHSTSASLTPPNTSTPPAKRTSSFSSHTMKTRLQKKTRIPSYMNTTISSQNHFSEKHTSPQPTPLHSTVKEDTAL
ncbi:hypothetical protein BDF14DRAFT_650068 [Spinellus fusiger]|nr:hypothetical protein BDF14DRAFT_650068 [Spinellus fusiger]